MPKSRICCNFTKNIIIFNHNHIYEFGQFSKVKYNFDCPKTFALTKKITYGKLEKKSFCR